MIIIGEKINATRKSIAAALEARDVDAIAKIAIQQTEAGADYIDVNGGDHRPGKEAENMAWLMDIVQSNTETPISVDSADPSTVKVGLQAAKAKPILNSISLESERLEAMLPIAAEHECMVVALLMSDAGPPKQVDDRVANTAALIEKLTGIGKKIDEIIVDPCFLPVAAEPGSGKTVVDAIAAIHAQWPEIHIGGGCSNVSFGLPKRKLVNFAMLSQAILHGMDTGIVDPCVPGLIACIKAAEAVAGLDDYCMNYVTAEREGKLG